VGREEDGGQRAVGIAIGAATKRRDARAEGGVGVLVGDEQDERVAVRPREFGAENGTDAGGVASLAERYGPVQVGGVGERDGGAALASREVHEFEDGEGAVEQ